MTGSRPRRPRFSLASNQTYPTNCLQSHVCGKFTVEVSDNPVFWEQGLRRLELTSERRTYRYLSGVAESIGDPSHY
jgi:hypothetical protein